MTFRHPTMFVTAGQKQAGKSISKQVLEHQLIQTSPARVFSVYGKHVAHLAGLRHLYLTIEYVQGMKKF